MKAERSCFDAVAERYASARRGYPAPVVDHVLGLAASSEELQVLEVAPGAGQLTRDLAARGHRVHAVELGPRLAEQARAALAPWPQASVEVANVEDWTPDASPHDLPAFDLAVCAQAFHWIDPDLALPRIADALRPGGTLALVWNLDRSQDLPVYAATTPVYDRHQVGGVPLPKRAGGREAALRESARFGEVETWTHAYQAEFTIPAWLELVQTFSSTLALPPSAQVAFLADLEAALASFDRVERRYETVVYSAPVLAPNS
jgi:SAM-dependent methyltransferase